MTRFGILDDDGQVIRWTWDRPSRQYRFIAVKVPRKRKPRFTDLLSRLGPAQI